MDEEVIDASDRYGSCSVSSVYYLSLQDVRGNQLRPSGADIPAKIEVFKIYFCQEKIVRNV